MRARSVVLLTLRIAISVLILQGLVDAQTVDPNLYTTRWFTPYQAKNEAKQFRVGILWYFPVKGTDELHPLFGEEPMSILSRRVVAVNVSKKLEEQDALRKKYGVDDKVMTFVMTDYYGNLIQRLEAKRGAKQKIDVERDLGKTLRNAKKWIEATHLKLKKIFKNGEHAYERKDWRKAIKYYSTLKDLEGFKESEIARLRWIDIIEAGEAELEQAKSLDDDAAIKALHKTAKTFHDTKIEKTALDRIEALKKKKQS